MRVFVAVELGPEVLEAACLLGGELQERVTRHAPGARVSWVPRARLHVTVRFVGEVREALAARVREALEAPLDVPAFDLSIGGVGTFPDRRSPRVIWAGAGTGAGALAAVRHEVDRRLSTLPVPPADGPLRPHVTLGRVRHPAGLRSGPLTSGLEEVPLGDVRVEAVTLFESRASPAGPVYVPLHRTRLAGPGAGRSQS